MPPKSAEKTDKPQMSFMRREVLAVALVLLAAAVIRIVYLLQYQAHAPYYSAVMSDSIYYDTWARRVASGEGYGPQPFYMAPLYPYVLALVYKAAGHGFGLVYALQAALGIVNLLLTYLLGRRFFGHASGLIAALVLMMYAPLAYLESKLLTETLAVTLNLASMLLILNALSRPSAPRFAAAGIVLGLSAVCRPVALITIAFVLVWLALDRRLRAIGFGRFAALALGVTVMILPVTVRNYVIGHDFALISTNGGIVFAQGNNPSTDGVFATIPGFTGSIMTQQKQEIEIARKALGHPVKPSESSAFWFKAGMKFIREQPGAFAKLILRKIIWSLHNREADCSYNVYLEERLVPALRVLFVPFWALAGLALFGFVGRRREAAPRESGVLGVYILSTFASLVIFTVNSRFRVPAVPVLALFAGCGLVRAAQVILKERAHTLIALAACVLPFVLVSLVQYPIAPITPPALANLGSSYVTLGDAENAVPVLKEALAEDPGYASPHSTLGTALVLIGDLDGAISHYRQALRITPGDASVRVNLGRALALRGRIREAVLQLQNAVRLDPDSAEAHAGLAEAFFTLGRREDSVRERDIANRLIPALAQDHFTLGQAFHARGRLYAAVYELREAIVLRQDFAEAHSELGLVLKDQGRIREATREYREAIRIEPNLVRAHNNLAIALYLDGKYSEAWREVHVSRKLGGRPHRGFMEALSAKMPEPPE